MGARISGIGSNLLTIEGVESLGGTEHRMLPDMIEIGSWVGLAAMTQSELTIKNVSWENLGLIPSVFGKLGIKIKKKGDDIYIPAHKKGYEIQNFIDGSILTIADAPWPGLTPDLLSIILVVATQARGEVLIHQKMFESRLFFVDKLLDMGAKIILCDPHRATVIGHDFKSTLKATTMVSPDIRAGVSLLIAALSAKGTSTIHNIEQIDRGYEEIDTRLKAIGAQNYTCLRQDCSSHLFFFESPIGVLGKSPFFSWMHVVRIRPGPSAETGQLVFLHSLLNLLGLVHDKGSVFGNRFGNRPSLQP